MERIFLATCPACAYRFPCHYDELRHAGVKLFCGQCHERFLPEDAAEILDPPDADQ